MTRKYIQGKKITAAWFCLLAVWCLSIHACTGIQDKQHRFRVIEEDGVEVALTTGGPRYSEPLIKCEIVLTLRQDLNHPESLLNQPRTPFLGPDGCYYVLDTADLRVAVFNQHGEYERSFGRSGSGPGEYQWMTFQSLKGDTLALFDLDLQRTTYHRLDGSVIDILKSPFYGLLAGLDRGPNGVLLGLTTVNSFEETTFLMGERLTILHESAGDTVAVIETHQSRVGMFIETVIGESRMMRSQGIPFTAIPVLQYVSGRGVLLSEGTVPEIDWYDLTGRLVSRYRLEMAPRPVTSELRSRYREKNRAEREIEAENEGVKPPVMPDPSFPDHAAYWDRIIVDDAGYLWLHDGLDEVTRNEGDSWKFHVVDPAGCYLGIVDLPVRSGRIMKGFLLGIVTDPETDERVPTVWRLISHADGFKYP